ncbi:hypothetical protein ZIOFF_005906 [Zingiber officinale]|uniref:FG-GAP repeat-containing protein n=1 Tax=Zingiber officinale TaxID=94328 RepID=A0A8J5HN26_ZINOF|nr:hypothetical protein ZIOFF_005906 [Zingiber officinale]
MRKRDLGILLLAAFALFFSLQQEGYFSFKEAWFHLSDEYPIKFEAERLPPPVVVDLNGDGKSEILVATHDAKIQTLGVVEGSFQKAYHIEVLHRLLTSWEKLCLDAIGSRLWLLCLAEDFPHGAHHKEITISISNYTLKHGDAGLIIVGGRMEMHHQSTMDLFEEIMTEEKVGDLHGRSTNEKENSGSSIADLRHFAFYAFAGRTGTLRWSRKNENIQVQSSDASQLIPQHHYKLDVHALNTRHPGEFECREFRESILGVMPHRWDRREDTSLELAHFRKHKRKPLKKTPGKVPTHTVYKPVEHNPPGKDASNKIARAIGKAADYAGSAKPKKLIIWYEGKVECNSITGTAIKLYVLVAMLAQTAKFWTLRSLYIPTITNHTQVWWVPNVVVAHQKEGIEVVHLASGRTICQLHLPEGGLHADINGDGVLDHVQVVGGNGAEQTVVSGSMEVLKPCWAVATSGVPVREQLFNVSICHHSPFNLFHHGDFSRSFGRNYDVVSLEVASPILVRRDDGHRHRKGSHGDVVFLTNRGEVTCYSPGLHDHEAIWRWQISAGVVWSNLPSPSGMMENVVVPTLKSVPLHSHTNKEVIVAAGEHEAVVISHGGSILATIDLPGPPTHALILEDFSNDGLTDIILVTSSGIYGFMQTRQPGALFFSTLIGCLIVVMVVIFVSLHLNSINKGKPRAPSDQR